MTAMPEPAGTIYDIGYRRYDGERRGRSEAIVAIVAAGLRAIFGLGRSGRSKILPWGAVVLALMPAVVAIATKVLIGDLITLYEYETYLWDIGALFPIFLAAQAPELVVNDIRFRVLPLYFSRPISRLDYVAAKLAALALGLLALTLAPVLVLWVGRVLATEDVVAALGDEIGALPGIVGSGLLHAVVLALIGLAICAVAGRRAYAAGAILALFLIGGGVSGIFEAQGGGLETFAPFTNPLAILDGTREWLFGGIAPGSPVAAADVAPPIYGLATLLLIALCAAVLTLRYRRITT